MSQQDNVVERMRSLSPDVPEIIMDQAAGSPVIKHLLNQGSLLDQQNVIIGEVLDRVEEQTTKTNGRVTTQEAIVRAHEKELAEYKAETKRWRRFLTAFLSFLGVVAAPVGTAILLWFLKKMGVAF